MKAKLLCASLLMSMLVACGNKAPGALKSKCNTRVVYWLD